VEGPDRAAETSQLGRLEDLHTTSLVGRPRLEAAVRSSRNCGRERRNPARSAAVSPGLLLALRDDVWRRRVRASLAP
jgi:hypothetical protein